MPFTLAENALGFTLGFTTFSRPCHAFDGLHGARLPRACCATTKELGYNESMFFSVR